MTGSDQISERVASLEAKMTAVHRRLDEIRDQITVGFSGMRDELDSRFVTQDEFRPVRMVVYSAIGIILIGVFGGMVGVGIKALALEKSNQRPPVITRSNNG